MAGLLDWLQTPGGMGLLSAAAGTMAGARRGQPWNTAGRGALAGLSGYASAQDQIRQDQENAFQRQYREMQMDQMRRQMETQKNQEAWRAGLPALMKPRLSGTTEQGNMLANQTADFGAEGVQSLAGSASYAPNADLGVQYGVDQQALQDYLLQKDSPYAQKIMEKQLFPDPADIKTVGKSLVRVMPDGTAKAVFSEPDQVDYNKPFLPDGTPNRAYQDFQISKSRAGATNIVNKIDNKTGESLAGQIGPMLKDSRTRALGAVKMADSADRLDSALKSGKVIAGPFATKRMFIAQLGSSLGITGPGAVEQTRQVIRGLAESSLEARKELQGQGQVTENEAKAVEKAMSGSIDDMTVPELEALVSLNRKAAKFTAEQHQFLLQEASSNPGASGVAKFYNVPGLDRLLKYQPPQAAPASGGAKFLGFE